MMQACIFDLDGVIVDTALYHFLSWQKLASHLGFEFTEDQNENLKGVSRMESLEFVLNSGGVHLNDSEKIAMADLKNKWYLEYITRMDGSEVLPGIIPLLKDLRINEIKLAIGSASKNAATVLNATGIAGHFDVIVDGNHISNGKPDPEVFILAATQLNCPPKHTVVLEDSYHGVTAANVGGFISIGIGNKTILDNAQIVFPDLSDMTFQKLSEHISLLAI